MKFFKVLLIFILVLIVLLGIAVFVAVQTIDAERIKGIAEDRITAALHRPATIKDLELGLSWKNGLNFAASGVVIKDLFQVDRMQLKLDARRFMTKKEIVIPTILIERPEIEWTPASREGLPIGEQPQDGTPGEEKKETPETEEITEFEIQEIIIRDGRFHFQDAVDGRPVDVTVSRLNVSITDFALDRPFPYKLDFGLMTGEKTLADIAGQAVILTASRQLMVKQLDVTVFLKNLDLEALRRLAPEIQDSGLQAIEDGQLTFKVPELLIGEKGLKDLRIEGLLSDLRIRTEQIPVPVTVDAQVNADRQQAQLDNLRVGIGKGSLSGTALVKDYMGAQEFRADVSLKEVQLAELVDLSDMNLQFRAELNGTLEAAGTGFDEAALQKNLRGTSRLQLKEAIIQDFNMLDYVLGQLPQAVKLGGIENLFTGLRSNLGARYQDQFAKKDTEFKVTDIVVNIAAGHMIVQQTDFGADGYFVRASGDLGLDGRLELRSEMFVSPEVSKDWMAKVSGLDILKDQSGRIRIPFREYRGPVTALGPPLPDLKDFAKQYYESRGKQELKGVLLKALDLEELAAPAVTGTQQLEPGKEAPGTVPQAKPEEVLIDTLLDGLFKKK